MLANRYEIAALTVADPAANQVDIKNLVDANRELTETVCILQKDAFDYLKKLLSPALAVKCQLIVKEETKGVDYISLTSTKPGLIRTMDFGSLSHCYFRFIKLVAPINSAERLCRDMSTNMVLNTNKGITIEMGIGSVTKMSNVLHYLSCLKHKEGEPAAMSAMNTKYT